MVSYVYVLLHLVEVMEALGHLWTISCFPFNNAGKQYTMLVVQDMLVCRFARRWNVIKLYATNCNNYKRRQHAKNYAMNLWGLERENASQENKESFICSEIDCVNSCWMIARTVTEKTAQHSKLKTAKSKHEIDRNW